MTTQKRTPAKQTPFAAPSSTQPAATTARRPWIKKTTVEVVLEQIGKQEEKVGGMRAAIAHEERELAKLQEAKKVLQGQ